jgi:MFS family permease
MKETLPKAMKSRFSFSLFRIGWKDVFEPKVVPVFWVMLFVSFSAGAMITLIPDTSKLVGWTNKGLYFTIYTISSILIRFFFSKASDQYGRIPVLIFGCFMLSLSMFLLVFSANSYLLIVSAIIYGMAWGVNTPTLAAWTNDLGDKNHMGRAMATMYIALEAGIGVGAYVSGEIYQGVASQIPIPFLLAALLSLLAFILLWTKKRNWTYGI